MGLNPAGRFAYDVRLVSKPAPRGAAGRDTQGDVLKESRMPFEITDKCTACGECKEVCPADAIAEGDPKYVIDPATCIDCGVCVDACPVEAIVEAE